MERGERAVRRKVLWGLEFHNLALFHDFSDLKAGDLAAMVDERSSLHKPAIFSFIVIPGPHGFVRIRWRSTSAF